MATCRDENNLLDYVSTSSPSTRISSWGKKPIREPKGPREICLHGRTHRDLREVPPDRSSCSCAGPKPFGVDRSVARPKPGVRRPRGPPWCRCGRVSAALAVGPAHTAGTSGAVATRGERSSRPPLGTVHNRGARSCFEPRHSSGTGGMASSFRSQPTRRQGILETTHRNPRR
jgi:hypothetical protein